LLSAPDSLKKVSDSNKMFLMGMAVHVADVSNPTKNWLL